MINSQQLHQQQHGGNMHHPQSHMQPSQPQPQSQQMRHLQQQHHAIPNIPSISSHPQQAQHSQQASHLQSFQKLTLANEQTWLHIGNLAETMNDYDRAIGAFENALRNNPYSIPALTQLAAICRSRDLFPKAVEYFQRILNIEGNNGEIWGALGHCYLMMEDLPKAYNSYQQALYHLPNPKEPKLWYGIGILYDRYGSLEHAEEAFTSVIKMDSKFEKANEIYFRLGIIYKQQGKYDNSLQCFRHILTNPPKPLTEIDVWFQIGHVYEFQKDFAQAKESYERVLKDSPNHAKVLQQLAWLYHQPSSFQNQDTAVQLLTKSIEADPNDAQSYYFLGRCYMAQGKHSKAYETYQQSVYRDGRNPLNWCSIGVLYLQIGQFRDALDAYTRAIRINPYISEVWYNLGVLYESCNNQIQDAVDAYGRALDLDPKNTDIQQRLAYLKQGAANPNVPIANPIPPPPSKDINPHTYRNGLPSQQSLPPLTQGGLGRPPVSGAPPGPYSQQQQQQQTSQNMMHQYQQGQVPGMKPQMQGPPGQMYSRPPPSSGPNGHWGGQGMHPQQGPQQGHGPLPVPMPQSQPYLPSQSQQPQSQPPLAQISGQTPVPSASISVPSQLNRSPAMHANGLLPHMNGIVDHAPPLQGEETERTVKRMPDSPRSQDDTTEAKKVKLDSPVKSEQSISKSGASSPSKGTVVELSSTEPEDEEEYPENLEAEEGDRDDDYEE